MKPFIPMVISLLIAVDALGGEPQPAAKASPRIVVEATYPGANAQTVADSVAAPIEQQVNGVDGAVQLVSRCDNDGRYLLEITFKPGVNLHKALVLVQNRVELAMPGLPREVQKGGVTVRMKSPVCVVVCLSSPTGKHDIDFLSNYVAVSLNDEFNRVAGVGDVQAIGKRDPLVTVRIDPMKLVDHDLTFDDVLAAIKKQNVQAAAKQIGQQPIPVGQAFQFTMQTQGRLADAKECGEIVIKTDGKKSISIKDVAVVELASSLSAGEVRFNGTAALALALSPLGPMKETSRVITGQLADLRKRLPEGLKLDVAFDGSADRDETLLLDVELPEGAAVEDVAKVLSGLEKLLRETKDVQDVLTLTKSPFDEIRNRPGVVVRLLPAGQRKASRDDVVKAIRSRLADLPGALIRLHDLSRQDDKGKRQDPIEMAIVGPKGPAVLDLAKKLGSRLQQVNTLTAVSVDAESTGQPRLSVDIDRAKAKQLDIQLNDVLSTMNVHLGSISVNDFSRFGRTWQIAVSTSPPHARAQELAEIRFRTGKGDKVPLKAFAEVKAVTGATAIHRIDLEVAVFLSANRAVESTPKTAREV